MNGCHWKDDTLILRLKVQPRAGRDEIAGPYGDTVKVRITAPPVDGKANEYLVAYLAEAFAVPRTRVILRQGKSGRLKTVAIERPVRIPEILGPLLRS